MGKYTVNTDSSGDSSSKAAHAEHDARKDAADDGVFERGNNSKNSTPFSRTDSAGQAASGFWDSIFGSKK